MNKLDAFEKDMLVAYEKGELKSALLRIRPA